MGKEYTPYGRRIRIRYATFINLITEIISYAASVIFIIVIARRLTAVEFGRWTLITRYVNYLLIASSIATYWVPRTLGRGLNTSKTALVFALKLGILASLIYTLLAYGSSIFFKQPFLPLALASVVVFEEYINKTLLSIIMAHSPQYIGVSRMILRFAQAALAVVSVVALGLGLAGVVLAAIGARAVVLVILYKINAEVVNTSIYLEGIERKWLRISWIPLFSRISSMLCTLDVVVVRAVTGSDIVLAYYGVAASIFGILLGFSRAVPALYSKLLSDRRIKYVFEASWVIFMVNIPLVIGMILYADVLAYLYNPVYYSSDVNAIRLFAASSILATTSRLYMAALTGLEARDFESGWQGKELLRTTLFKVPLVKAVAAAVYLLIIYYVITSFSKNPATAVSLWAIVYICYNIALIITYNIMLRKEFTVRIPYKDLLMHIFKFIIASIPIIVMRFTYNVTLSRSIWATAESFAPVVLVSIIGYFSLLYLLDDKFRQLVRRAKASVTDMHYWHI